MLYAWYDDRAILPIRDQIVRYFSGVTGTILDLGCGEGAFLEGLSAAGHRTYGVDRSEAAVAHCRARGLTVSEGDSLEHLGTVADGSLAGILCSHLIEHLQPPTAIALLGQAHRALAAGGRLVLITPDARDLRTTERFWLDVTHVRPYPEKLLVTLLVQRGFSIARIEHLQEPTATFAGRMAKLFLRLWFMGLMFRGDLVLVAQKDGNGSRKQPSGHGARPAKEG